MIIRKRAAEIWQIPTPVSLLLAMAISFGGAALAQSAPSESFNSPQAASEALYKAVKQHDREQTLAILGPSVEEWLLTGDPVYDRNAAARFIAAYEQKHGIEMRGDAKAVLTVGADDFPFAFPVLKKQSRWKFDPESGKDELLTRRIGENELNSIKVLQSIVDAQFEYASKSRGKSDANQYARKFASSPGKRDGLYWPVNEGEILSPLGALVANAAAEGYRRPKNNTPAPFHGYTYRMLLSQGSDTPGSITDYVVNGRMIGGFAVLAHPAKYRVSGIMTFMVSHDGTVYQKDLGPETAAKSKSITAFNPNNGWQAYIGK